MFYLGTYLLAFAFGFPLGPSSLEMLRISSMGRRVQAWSMALGVAVADACWALFAQLNLMPWLGANRPGRKGFLYLLAAAMTLFLAGQAWQKNRTARGTTLQTAACTRREGHAFFWRGALLGISYPLTFGSWLLALSVFRNLGWQMPPGVPWIALFFTAVLLGYFSYLAFLQLAFRRLWKKRPPESSERWNHVSCGLMLALALVFLALALIDIVRVL